MVSKQVDERCIINSEINLYIIFQLFCDTTFIKLANVTYYDTTEI